MDLKGLTQKEVEERIEKGEINIINNTHTKTIKEIVLSNIFTYFNILNVVLALAIVISGIIFNRFFYSLKNSLFLGVVICNTVIGTSQSGLATAKSTWLNSPQEEAAGRRVLK